jgi:hypothetical protein
LVEPILNLYRAGTPPQTISLSFNISLEAVMSLVSSQQKDPSHARSVLQSLEQRSEEFRCSLTKRLMGTPVVASDGKLYNLTALSNWLKSSKVSPVTGEQLSQAKPYPLVDLKGRIREFSRVTLCQLEVCFKADLECLNLAAECLAALILEESFTQCLGSLSYLDYSQQSSLIKALVPLVPPQALSKLLLELLPLTNYGSCLAELLRAILKHKPEHEEFKEFSVL